MRTKEELAAYSAAYYADNKERIAADYAANREERCAKARAYRAEHREEIKAREKARYQRRREQQLAYHKEHYRENKEQILARNSSYQKSHRKEINAKRAECSDEKNAERIARMRAWTARNYEHRKRYYAENRDKYNAYGSARRALVIGATIGNLSEIKEIYRVAKESPIVRCYLCGSSIPLGERHVDHIIPLSKGGEHRPSNLAIACASCNLSKSNKMPNEVGVLL